MSQLLRCACGALRGRLAAPEKCTRIVCYCTDCQAFAHYLDRPDALDAQGGSCVVIAHPQQLTFTHGVDNLASMSLSEKGMLRWYASCCNTPIGNISRNRKMAFLGVSTACLADPAAFGPVRMRSATKSATGEVAPSGIAAVVPILGFAHKLLGALVTGSYRRNPFFNADGSPVVPPTVLTPEQRRQLP